MKKAFNVRFNFRGGGFHVSFPIFIFGIPRDLGTFGKPSDIVGPQFDLYVWSLVFFFEPMGA